MPRAVLSSQHSHHPAPPAPHPATTLSLLLPPTAFLISAAVSLLLAALLHIDPWFNKPSGLLPLSLFTSKPSSHGGDVCDFDYEGSWQVGVLG